ncbi:Lipoprotein-releasing system transmembrane protein LolC [Vibrio aerogenes CECT 7868]|uniref:Lipoprotein-releasing system transmembrane protein LolC n=1 Tax=Vibrio aerogenes CECT 7868 TaxID=1216006 RepID=A0A1M5X625_9VIBR|nr:lipoprotein-releasing ABC transporter permease subunit LolC [Vibrio aerogenes]SHH95290.1 Lipoprotein-releasing system transmembrane protein LolC [Vibrio aerogenes CECT 7868]
MFHPVSVFIGLRYLRGQSGDRFSRFVSRISTAGITIGVLSLVVVLSVMNGFESQLKGRILGVLPQAMVYQQKEKTPWSKTSPAFISGLSVSHQAEPLVRSEAVIQSTTELSAGILLGILPETGDPVSDYLIAGDMKNIYPGAYSVFLGSQLARRLNVTLGDKVRLMVTQASLFTPLGRIPSQRNFIVAGIFNTGSDIDGQLMITHIRDAQRLLRLQENVISGWRLFFNDPFVVSDIDRNALPEGWHWSDWREQRGELFQAVKMEKNMMGLMLGLIVAIAAFNIISALIMVVMEKQSEVAILKTQGMNKLQVLFIFIVQGASSGIVGAVSGGILGILLASYLNEILSVLGVDLRTLGGSLPVDIHLVQVFVVELFTIGLSILATFYPSLRASSVHPAEALRYE